MTTATPTRTRDERLTYGHPVQVEELSADGTLLRVSGPPADVGAWIQTYMLRYDPRGYATRVDPKRDSTVDGVRTATVSRWNSCD